MVLVDFLNLPAFQICFNRTSSPGNRVARGGFVDPGNEERSLIE